MTARVEDVAEVVLGQTYSVLHVPLGGLVEDFVPVLGDPHYDPDVDPRVPAHWHFDWRFAGLKLWNTITTSEGIRTKEGITFKPAARRRPGMCYRGVVHAAGRETCRMDAVCVRVPPPFEIESQPNLSSLEETFASTCLEADCRVCPHRGLPFAAGPPPIGSVATCPGHGLSWDLATGKLVRRAG